MVETGSSRLIEDEDSGDSPKSAESARERSLKGRVAPANRRGGRGTRGVNKGWVEVFNRWYHNYVINCQFIYFWMFVGICLP